MTQREQLSTSTPKILTPNKELVGLKKSKEQKEESKCHNKRNSKYSKSN